MKKIIIFILFVSQAGYSQIDTSKHLTIALSKANLMVESFQFSDYDTFLDLMHPKIIILMGGRDKLNAMFKKGLGPGVKIVSNELTTPDKLIIQGSTYQCAFPQKQVISINGQKMYTLGTLIGISYNSGVDWAFIGVTKNKLSDLQVHFPELSNDLNVRIQTDPILLSE